MGSLGNHCASILRLQTIRDSADELLELWTNSVQKSDTLHWQKARKRWEFGGIDVLRRLLNSMLCTIRGFFVKETSLTDGFKRLKTINQIKHTCTVFKNNFYLLPRIHWITIIINCHVVKCFQKENVFRIMSIPH